MITVLAQILFYDAVESNSFFKYLFPNIRPNFLTGIVKAIICHKILALCCIFW